MDVALIADHILWLLLVGGVLSLLVVGKAAFAIRRWFRSRRDGPSGSPFRLAGAALVLVTGGLGLLFTGSGLVVMGPDILAHKRMLGDRAPEFVYTRVADGVAASLADHEGSVVLVNQWATWCPPCVKEMSDLDRLQEAYRARGLVVVHISDESMETLARYLAARPMSTEHGRAEPLPWPDAGRPTTFLVDREGVVRKVALGGRSYEQFEAMVTPLL